MIIIIIVLCTTGLTALGVLTGHDGLLLTTGITLLGTVAGWQGKKKHIASRDKKIHKAIEKFEAGEIEAGLKELQNVR